MRLFAACRAVGTLALVSLTAACGARVEAMMDAGPGDVVAPPEDTGVAPVDTGVVVMRGGRGAVCAQDAECADGLLCARGADLVHTCTIACTSDAQCIDNGERCAVDRSAGAAPRAVCGVLDMGTGEEGSACARDNECGSNFCVDRVCRFFCSMDAECATGARCLPSSLSGLRVCGFEPVTAPRVDEFTVLNGPSSVDRPMERTFELAPDAVSFALTVQDLEGRDLIASVLRLTAPDSMNWIDGNSWSITAEQPIRDILAMDQINSVLAPSSDTLRLLSGRYTYFAGLFNDRMAMTSAISRRANITLRVKRAPGGNLPATGTLRVRFYFVPGAGVTAATAMGNARIQAAIAGMRTAYSGVGITVMPVGFEDVTAADAARFTVIDAQSEIDDLFTKRAAGRSDEVSVFFVRSIAATTGLDGAIGVAGDIVGPPGIHGTIHSGVVISLDGTFNGGGARDLLSNTLSHEVGHYLGLWHTRESRPACTSAGQTNCSPFGGVDPISDTPTDNTGAARYTMFWAAAPNVLLFSPGQGKVLRSSVIIN
jgi:hypothetical protein